MMQRRQQGFTLIEIIGVLAIMAIIASAITPGIVHDIRRAKIEAEDRSLDAIIGALRRSVTEQRTIPGTAAGEWNSAAALYLAIPETQLSSNASGGGRRLISRPTNGLGGVPYDQGARFSAGATAQGTLPTSPPIEARLLLVSDFDGQPASMNLSNVRFDAVWNQSAPPPPAFVESRSIRIARCSLADLFYPVTVHCVAPANVPRWSLDAAAAKSLSAGVFTVYLIAGTRINLFIGAALQATIVVDRARGITFDGMIWSY